MAAARAAWRFSQARVRATLVLATQASANEGMTTRAELAVVHSARRASWALLRFAIEGIIWRVLVGVVGLSFAAEAVWLSSAGRAASEVPSFPRNFARGQSLLAPNFVVRANLGANFPSLLAGAQRTPSLSSARASRS